MQLAERMHASELRWISGGSGYINPRGELAPSSTDFRMSIGAEARLSMNEVIPIEMKNIDFFFAGGLQIDAMGNTNLAGIPTENGWKLRGPGSVGLPFLIRAGRIYLYTLNHSKRSLVAKVNYISGPGYVPNNPYGGGPELLVTNLCAFRWNKKTNKWRLESIHEGVSLEKVKGETGFEFEYGDQPEITKPPTNEELTVIRSIDPIGYLRGYSD